MSEQALPSAGALQQVWQVVQQAQGALTATAIARQIGLAPELVEALLTWLVQRGYIQRWDDGRVCATDGRACRWCALRAWCPGAEPRMNDSGRRAAREGNRGFTRMNDSSQR